MNARGYVHMNQDASLYPTLVKEGEGGFEKGKWEGNIAMPFLLKSIKDPARLQWHKVKKVDHSWLGIDALTEPMKVCEESMPYGDHEKGWYL